MNRILVELASTNGKIKARVSVSDFGKLVEKNETNENRIVKLEEQLHLIRDENKRLVENRIVKLEEKLLKRLIILVVIILLAAFSIYKWDTVLKKPSLGKLPVRVSRFGADLDVLGDEKVLSFLSAFDTFPLELVKNSDRPRLNIILTKAGSHRLSETFSLLEWKRFVQREKITSPSLLLFVHICDGVEVVSINGLESFNEEKHLATYVSDLAFDESLMNMKPTSNSKLAFTLASIVSSLTLHSLQ